MFSDSKHLLTDIGKYITSNDCGKILKLLPPTLVSPHPPRLKLSPSPSSRVTVARISGSSSSRSSKRKRVEAQDISEAERAEGQLVVSEEATASAGVSISPTDMEGKAVTLVNENEQVRPSGLLPRVHVSSDARRPALCRNVTGPA